MRNYRLLTPLVGAAMLVAVPVVAAAPDKAVAAAVADKSRLAENRKLDDGRHPADLLAGNGYYSEMLADLVGPKGTVIPMNPSGFHEPETWATITKAYPNIAPMVRPVNTIVLAPKSVDMIFTHLAYHDLYWQSEKFKFPRVEVDAMLVNWFSAVRPGGSIIVVDHVGPAGDTRELVEKLHRIDPAKVRADMERAGFVFDGDSGALRITADDHSKNVFDPAIRGKTDRFMMRFKKPA